MKPGNQHKDKVGKRIRAQSGGQHNRSTVLFLQLVCYSAEFAFSKHFPFFQNEMWTKLWIIFHCLHIAFNDNIY